MSKQDVLIASTGYFQISFKRHFGYIDQVAQGAVILEARLRALAEYGQTRFPLLCLFQYFFPALIKTRC